ncbi:BQ5605_C011g06671 [Microbotryum silenes-dioicae]|uniref:BQ5605_C011g06671 protein n=1 Tax=Microbotryum silenes-dioicae TaxID=796604 RepID=A0A2X0LT24_9BASI|nr:BQ5605_C011g06671 [Microbotryum silenes-dioicae]
MAASNIATNSSKNSLQHILFECQPSSCFFTASCGRIDFVRLRIRVIGTPNFFAEPCLYRINIDGSFYFQKI